MKADTLKHWGPRKKLLGDETALKAFCFQTECTPSHLVRMLGSEGEMYRNEVIK